MVEEHKSEEEIESHLLTGENKKEVTGERRDYLLKVAKINELPLDYENIYYAGYCKKGNRKVKIYEYYYPDKYPNVYAYYDTNKEEAVILGNLGDCEEIDYYMKHGRPFLSSYNLEKYE